MTDQTNNAIKKAVVTLFVIATFIICLQGACNRLKEDKINPVQDNGDITKDSNSYIYKDTLK